MGSLNIIMSVYPFPLSSNKFYSWIPTTLTALSFDFVADESNLAPNKSLVLKDELKKQASVINFNPPLSDKFLVGIIGIFRKNEKELKPITEVHLSEIDDKEWTFSGTTKIRFLTLADYKSLMKSTKKLESEDVDNQTKLKQELNTILSNYPLPLEFEISFKVEKTGKVEFENLKINGNFKNKDTKEQYDGFEPDKPSIVLNEPFSTLEVEFILQALYTFTKRAFHADLHHHEKIDVIIPVIESIFDASIICESMGKYIKIIEKEVINNIYMDIDRYSRAEGIYAYAESFKNKFSNNITTDSICYCSQIKNIVTSIKAKDTREKIIKEKKLKHFSDIFTNFKYLITILPGTFILFFAFLNFLLVTSQKSNFGNEFFLKHSDKFDRMGSIIVDIISNPIGNGYVVLICVLYSSIFLSSLIKVATLFLIKKIGSDRLSVINLINPISFTYFIVFALISLVFGLISIYL